jgi:pyruvate kinase
MTARVGDPRESAPASWDAADCGRLIDELSALRQAMLDHEARLEPWIQRVDPAQRASAVNLAHYLAMRRHDLRSVQQRLAALGLSSLGRAETHALANLDKVLGILHRLADLPWTPRQQDEPAGFRAGPALLERNAERLLGAAPADRRVRIMVTMPSEAAFDTVLVDRLVEAGMDIARINCAHDDASAWAAMSGHVRAAARRIGRPVRVLMDHGGPKLRTGAVEGGPAVLKLQPRRDPFGRVLAPWFLHLRALPDAAAVAADASLAVDPRWPARRSPGDVIKFVDAREARRQATVVEVRPEAARLEGRQTAYLVPGTLLRVKGRQAAQTRLEAIAPLPGVIHLQRGQRVRLQGVGIGRDAATSSIKERQGRLATIACTLPDALAQLRMGERVWFDDGRIARSSCARRGSLPSWRSPTRAKAATGWGRTRASTCPMRRWIFRR